MHPAVYSLMQDAANFAYKESDCSPPTPEPSSELPSEQTAVLSYVMYLSMLCPATPKVGNLTN